MKKITKKNRREYTRFMLANSEKWAMACLEMLFESQTLWERGEVVTDRLMFGDEYASADVDNVVNFGGGSADYKNNEGFNKYDADILTSIYKFFKENGFLSKRQMAV